MNDQELLRYSRHIMLPEIDIRGQQAICTARVAVIGLGGLGSIVSMYLAASGLGRLVLVDFDEVDLSNLQRQIIHSDTEIGRKKVDSARDRLYALNPSLQVEVVAERLTAKTIDDVLADIDVVVDACDNFQTRFLINDACVQKQIPLVSGAAIRFEGQLSVFNTKDRSSPCYRCLYDDKTTVAESCTNNGVLSPLLGVIGSLQASETLKLLMGVGDLLCGKLLLFDALHNDWHIANLPKDPKCPVCQNIQ